MRTFVTIALLAFASAFGQDMAGEYRLNMPEVASALLLRPDGSFEYAFTYGAADYTGKGTWKREADSVILNSSGKEEPPFRLVKSAPARGSEVRVHVQAPNGRGVPNLDVRVVTAADSEEARTDANGTAVLPRRGTATSILLHVPVYDVEGGPFEVTGNAAEFWFEINGEAITQVRFRNERLKITRRGLEMTYWKTDKPLHYTR